MAPRELPRVEMSADGDDGLDSTLKDIPGESIAQKNDRKASYQDPYGDANRARLDARMAEVRARTVPQMSGATVAATDQRNSNQARGQQQSLIKTLQDAAAGKGPSVANEQLKQATDRNMSQAYGMAAAGRGGSAALAMRNAAANRSQASQEAAGQSAMLRASEMQDATRQLSGAIGGMRDQDLSQAGTEQNRNMANAGFQQDAGKANLGATLDSTKQNDGQQMMALMQRMGIDQSQWEANKAYQVNRDNRNLQTEAIARGISTQNAQNVQQGVGTGATALAALLPLLAAMSDRRVKKNVKDGDEDVEALLDALKAESFEYSDPVRHGHGDDSRRVGIMAQALEKSDAGSKLVIDTPEGKAVDKEKALMAALASVANLNKRIRKLEK